MPTPLTLEYQTPTVSSIPSQWCGIPYKELVADWQGTANNNTESQAQRTLICRWSDLSNFLDFLLYCNNYTVISGFPTVYYIGAQHPLLLDCFVDSVQVVPQTNVASAESTFDYARLLVRYKSLPFSPENPTTVREDSIEPMGQVIMVPKVTVSVSDQYGSTPVRPPHDVPVYLPILKITSTLLNVATVPLGAINAATNCISQNNLTFNYGGQSYSIPGDTILYCGASSKRTLMSNGQSKYQVTHTFIVSPIHNKMYDPTSNSNDLIQRFVLPPDGFLNYQKADFSGLGV